MGDRKWRKEMRTREYYQRPTLPRPQLCFRSSQGIATPKESKTSLVAQMLKNLPAMQETLVRFLDWEDPLEKDMAPHSQYSCLENSMDRRIWQAEICGVTKNRK